MLADRVRESNWHGVADLGVARDVALPLLRRWNTSPSSSACRSGSLELIPVRKGL